MRFKITFQIIKNNTLPASYQYELSSWIYKTIHYGNKEFADFLHSKGYISGTKKFKLFTFSRFNFPVNRYEFIDDRLIIKSQHFDFNISFMMNDAVEPFIVGLFQQQQLTLGDKKSKVEIAVKSIEKLPEPEWKETMTFKTISPVVISKMKVENDKAKAKFLEPTDADYENLFFQNLFRKYLAVTQFNNENNANLKKDGITKFELIGKSKPKLIKIKADTPQQTFIKGYYFSFKLTAPVELIKIGYDAGFGEKNSLGFGCGEVNSVIGKTGNQ